MKCVGMFVKSNAPLFNRLYFSLSVDQFRNCEVSGNVWFGWKRTFKKRLIRQGKWEFSSHLMKF